jgi:hypothetical protein
MVQTTSRSTSRPRKTRLIVRQEPLVPRTEVLMASVSGPLYRCLREAAPDNTLSQYDDSMGRGLELLPEDGCLWDGGSQRRNRLREIED